MQTIMCYVSPVSRGSVLGVFRDRLNSMGGALPVLSAGVPCVLKLRVFSEPGSTTPFPLDGLVGVTDWSFELDNDYDSATTVKLVADNGDITAATVIDDGSTFTEFTIPISNTLTTELEAVLTVKPRITLVGELVGRDSNGAAQFVLQIKNFVIRNRISDPATPTPVPTKSYAEIAEAAVSGAILSSGLATSADVERIASGAAVTVASGAVVSVSGGLQSQINECPTSSGAKLIASEAIASGGYAKSSEVRETVSGAVAAASQTLQAGIDALPTSGDARQIAEEVMSSGGGVMPSGAIVSGAEFTTVVGGYTVALTSGGGLSVSGSGASVVLSGGQIAANIDSVGELGFNAQLSVAAGGIILHAGDDDNDASIEVTSDSNIHISASGADKRVYVDADDDDGFRFNNRPVATQLVTSTSSEMQPVVSVLSGGTSYIFDSDHLYSLEVASVVKTTENSFIHFTLDSVTAPTPVVISGYTFSSGRFEGGKEYLVGFFDGMAVVNEVTSGGVLQ